MRLSKILIPKYGHTALFKVKYGSCLTKLCLSARKEVKNIVFTGNFNFVTTRIPIQPDKRINLILLYLFLYFFFFFLSFLNVSRIFGTTKPFWIFAPCLLTHQAY